MCNIYRNALFTISAAHAERIDEGCFSARDGLVMRPCELKWGGGMIFPGIDRRGLPKSFFILPQDVRVAATRSVSAPLYSRAWVLQEQILSPRTLIYDSSQIMWQCISSHALESKPDLTTNNEYMPFGQRISSLQHGLFAGPIIMDDEREMRIRMAWYRIVEDYTLRGLTQIRDKLPAIGGIADTVAQLTKDTYLAGLWRKSLWHDLLWYRFHNHNRRAEDLFVRTRRSPIAPSWSWASVEGAVRYQLPNFSKAECVVEIFNVFVSGSISGQSGKIFVQGQSAELILPTEGTNLDEMVDVDTGAKIRPLECIFDLGTSLMTRIRVVSIAENRATTDCLMLLPTENSCEYLRVGYLRLWSNNIPSMKRMRLTIV